MAQHGGFIVAAYLVTGTVLIGTIAAVLFDYRLQLRALARLAPDRLGPVQSLTNDTPASKLLSPDVVAPRHHLVRILVVVPLLVLLGIATLLVVRLGADNPSLVPSALIGRPVPQFALAPLDGLATPRPPGLSSADLKAGHVTLVNVFASWCVECHNEHEALMALSRGTVPQQYGVKLTGIIYKDDPGKARSYLDAEGDPFAQVGTDLFGRTGIDFGVYLVPETYVVKGDGTIAYKLVGGISDATRPALMAAIARAQRP